VGHSSSSSSFGDAGGGDESAEGDALRAELVHLSAHGICLGVASTFPEDVELAALASDVARRLVNARTYTLALADGDGSSSSSSSEGRGAPTAGVAAALAALAGTSTPAGLAVRRPSCVPPAAPPPPPPPPARAGTPAVVQGDSLAMPPLPPPARIAGAAGASTLPLLLLPPPPSGSFPCVLTTGVCVCC
jgi:hypothetical protein